LISGYGIQLAVGFSLARRIVAWSLDIWEAQAYAPFRGWVSDQRISHGLRRGL